MKSVYEKLKPLAETDEQKKVLLNELNIYKSKYIEHLNAVLDAKSRTLSAMITGSARFPTSRSQKALNVADKRIAEFLDWNKKAVNSIKFQSTLPCRERPILCVFCSVFILISIHTPM